MSTPGRKKHAIWEQFTSIPQENTTLKTNRVRCRKCKKELVGLVKRMEAHFQQCSTTTGSNTDANLDADRDVEEELLSDAGSSRSSDNSSATPTSVTTLQSKNASTSSSASVNISMKRFIIATSQEDKKKIDLQLSRYMFATNTPFNHVEHPELLKLMEILRPGYKPPNRKQIAGKLLDEVYNSTQEAVKNELKNKVVNLAIDGWSNVRQDSIVCVCVTDVLTDSTHLIDTIDTGAESHTADYLVKVTTAAIKQCETYKCTVRSVVTDNAANMSRMRRDLAQQEELASHEDILTYGCSSHILNLLAKDLNAEDITDKVKSIMRYFKYTHFASAKYKEAGGKAIVIPQQVRWNTMADCLKVLLENWHIMSDICLNHSTAIDLSISLKVNDMALKQQVQALYKKLENIAVTLDISQKTSCCIGEVTEAWIELKNMFEGENVRLRETEYSLDDLRKFKARYEMAMSPAHFAANLLHPKYRGENLTSEDISEALLFIEAYHREAMPYVVKYRAMTDPFHNFLFEDHVVNQVGPLEWWQSLKKQINGQTMNFVAQLHTAVASSAGIERLFSTFGFIHSDVRNKLGTEKAAKLVTVFKYLNKEKKK